jgi:hypothetical protein
MKRDEASSSGIDNKVVALVVGAVFITAIATGLFFTYGGRLSSSMTTSQSAHAASAANCIVDYSAASPGGPVQALETCTFSDGRTLHCLIVFSAGLFCA